MNTQTNAASLTAPIAGEAAAGARDVGDEGIDAVVRFTPIAASKVHEIRQAEGIEDTLALRLRVVGGGCAGFSYDLYFDDATEVDRVVEISGVKCTIDEMSLMYLAGTEVDYVEGLQGQGFKFQNPNVKSTCGCGSSFSV
ncbi:MAG: iron-sulfur cluster insertion protein ErpA [Myxococcales bacterium]|nr:iron-sulfur cluster insertion protein ErpA [Myxococcales bacterium]